MRAENKNCLINEAACGRIEGSPVCPKCGMDERVVYPGQEDLDAALFVARKRFSEHILAETDCEHTVSDNQYFVSGTMILLGSVSFYLLWFFWIASAWGSGVLEPIILSALSVAFVVGWYRKWLFSIPLVPIVSFFFGTDLAELVGNDKWKILVIFFMVIVVVIGALGVYLQWLALRKR